MTTFRNEPPADFSRAANQQRMSDVLDAAHKSAPVKCPLWLEDGWVETSGEIVSDNPSDKEEVVAIAASADVSHVDAAIASATQAAEAWTSEPVQKRADCLRRVASYLRDRRFEINACIVLEAGKAWVEADADVCEAIDFLEYYALEAERLAEPQRLMGDIPGEINQLHYEPLGLTAIIAPWNFPLAIATGMTAAALVAGNCTILKPAEQTPATANYLARAMEHAGFPRGVFTMLHGPGEVVGAALVQAPQVRLIAFTGSREVGLGILRESANIREGQSGIKRTILELGGKNAMIVDDTADLDAAIPDILHSAFGFAGQKCSALSRLIVHQDVIEPLTKRLVEAADSMIIAPAEDPSCQIGPVIEQASVKRLDEALQQAERDGAVLHHHELGELRDRGWYSPSVIVSQLDAQHRLAQEELFGPFLTLLSAASFDEALDIANGTDYALTGGVHSRTLEHLERAKHEFHVGNLYLNRTITGAIVGRQPFGGFRFSGIGSKAGGPDYLKQFMVASSCSENIMRHGFAPLEATG
jgi:RHH-type proline utilization regulon transcriptional repressor/proline dehydrogenase/delta 1-pyrroline-5-carboxylate dehydrogenase